MGLEVCTGTLFFGVPVRGVLWDSWEALRRVLGWSLGILGRSWVVLRVALGVLGGRPGSPHGRSVFWRARARGLVGLLGGSSAGLGVVFGDLGMVFAGSWGGRRRLAIYA